MKKLEKPTPLFSNESIRLVSYCPLCNTQYNPLTAKLLDERDEAHLIYFKCQKCGSSIVALILATGLGVSSIGLITDLSDEDALLFKDSTGIETNDILNLYQLLNSKINILNHFRKSTYE